MAGIALFVVGIRAPVDAICAAMSCCAAVPATGGLADLLARRFRPDGSSLHRDDEPVSRSAQPDPAVAVGPGDPDPKARQRA